MLYVGKARDLKKRVSSYFQKRPRRHAHRTGTWCRGSRGMETTVVRSEAEALLLENNLIKTLAPRFNILFRRRQELSVPEDRVAPRFRASPTTAARSTRSTATSARIPSAWAVKESIQLLQKVFRLRTCEDTVFANRTRPCLLYQIKRCSAPCVDYIAPEDYARDVRQCRALPARRAAGADGRAAGADDGARRGAAVRAGGRAAQPDRRAVAGAAPAVGRGQHRRATRDVDILAVKVDGGRACVNLAMVRGGRHLGDRPYFPKHVEDAIERRATPRTATSEATAPRRGAVARGAGARGVHRPALPRRRPAAAAGAQPRRSTRR